MAFQAVIFDLDGVITDTAEFHYQAWQQLADEEELTFNREINEKLRGVPRRESLMVILNGRSDPEVRIQEMMARKNSYYVAKLGKITPDDLLPGVARLLDQLDRAEIPYAVASASKNAAAVCHNLGIAGRLAVQADGNSVARQKPHPDLFRFTAARLNVPAGQCLVIEDAAAGIEAALAAGMPALGLGPPARFAAITAADGSFARRDNLEAVTLDELHAAATPDSQWHVVQREFDPARQHHMETVFTLGNGYFATRGSFEEGFPGDRATTFAHGVWDDMPVSFTGLVNLPNWLDMTIQVDGETFRMDEGELLHFRRTMNLKHGILRREVRWQAANGQIVDLLFERFASYTQEHIGAVRLLVTAVSPNCSVTIHTGINGHVANENLLHWRLLDQGQEADGLLWLQSRTRKTGMELGTAAKVTTNGTAAGCQDCPGHPRFTITQELEAGQTVQVDKITAYTAARDTAANFLAVTGRATALVRACNYDDLRAAHIAAWEQLWRNCIVSIEGDDEAQLAVRFNLFQLLVAAPKHDERVSIGAKSLSGYGYFGHVFWDTEIFILPFFIYTQPQLARNMLMYRYHTLPGARRKAAGNGFEGAQYAWESAATGDEVTPTWVPHFSDRTRLVRIWTGDIQIHISADITYAIMQYWRVTGDDAFLRDYGAEIILDTARFWGSRAEPEETENGRRYAFRNVIGPDEYHDHVDNNSFTNYVARWHLQTALELLDWLKVTHPAKAAQLIADLHLSGSLFAQWQDVIDHTVFLYDETTGLIDQFENFFDLEAVSPEFIAQADKSLQVIFGIEGANERQVLKQADVIMLLCLFRDQFNRRVWQTNWDVYMPKTDHVYGSSLGPSFHAWAACEIGRPEEAYQHFMLAARADLHNPRGNAGDGIHAASAGGLWQAMVLGFAGLKMSREGHTLTPRLPAHWQRLAFNYQYQGERYVVDIQRLGDGEKEVKILHKKVEADE
jgi:kojibiose phosphorylase